MQKRGARNGMPSDVGAMACPRRPCYREAGGSYVRDRHHQAPPQGGARPRRPRPRRGGREEEASARGRVHGREPLLRTVSDARVHSARLPAHFVLRTGALSTFRPDHFDSAFDHDVTTGAGLGQPSPRPTAKWTGARNLAHRPKRTVQIAGSRDAPSRSGVRGHALAERNADAQSCSDAPITSRA